MATYTRLSISSYIRNPKTNEAVTIFKIQKDGTKRIFFQPIVVIEGQEKRITGTLWARLYDAENLAKRYLNRNE